MATLRNHPGYWMRDDAEASLARWEADHGKIAVNSAARSVAEQQRLINRWNQGGTYNRPPYLYEPKRPAEASAHVKDGGIAFDTPEWRRFLATAGDYGWVQTYPWDVVHFEYFPSKDKKRNRPSGGSESKPTTPTTSEEEEDMEPKFIAGAKLGTNGTVYQLRSDGKKRKIPSPEWTARRALQKAGDELVVGLVPDADLAKIPNA